jgi:hypothetical protein
MNRIWAVHPGNLVSVPGRGRDFPSLHSSARLWGQESEADFLD